MSYYVLPDYWVSGYAEGDAVEISATSTPSLALSIITNGVVNLEFLLEQSAALSVSVVRSTPVSVDQVQAALSVSADAFRSLSFSSTASGVASLDADTSVIFSGDAAASTLLTFDPSIFRVTDGSANISNSCIMLANSRFLWLDLSDTDETWTDVSEVGEIWTVQSDTAETWERV